METPFAAPIAYDTVVEVENFFTADECLQYMSMTDGKGQEDDPLKVNSATFSSLAQSYIDDMMVFILPFFSSPRQNDCWMTYLWNKWKKLRL